MVCFEQNLTAELFTSFLEDLKKDADRLYRRRIYRLCMDKDSKHTAKKSLEYMEDAQINCCADWPPRSPDLNPIENIWGLMEKELKKLHITNSYHLKQALKNIWSRLKTPERLRNLINSMSNRMKDLVASKGSKINY